VINFKKHTQFRLVEKDKTQFLDDDCKHACLSLVLNLSARISNLEIKNRPDVISYIKERLEDDLFFRIYGDFRQPLFEFIRFCDKNVDPIADNTKYVELRSKLIQLASSSAAREAQQPEPVQPAHA